MKRKGNCTMHNVAGEYILVPLGELVVNMNGLLTLNETGAFLWTELEQERSFSDLAADLSERFDVDDEQARLDVQAFLEELARLELLA